MEELSPEARALYELLKADTAEEYEKRFIDYKKEVLDAFHPFVVDTRAQLKSVDSGMAALSSDLQGVKVQIGQDLDAVRTTLSTEVANLTAAIAGLPRHNPTTLARDPSTSQARESDGTNAGPDGHRWTHNSRGMAAGTTLPPPGGAYELNPDPVHYTTKFLDGLQPGVRILVAIQQPRDLDTAYSLALLYEELGTDCGPSLSLPAQQYVPPRRSSQPVVPPITPPPPPSRWVSQKVEENRRAEQQKGQTEDKWQSLRAYRRSKNLCFTCGEKYHREHQCKNTIQLHVVQEMIDFMQFSDSGSEEKFADASASFQADSPAPDPHLMMLSIAAVNVTVKAPKTMKLQVIIQDQQFLFLVDSGSSTCFIDTQKAKELSGVTPLVNPIKVKVAGGAILHSNFQFAQLGWSAAGAEFKDDFKVLDLGSYDGIIGLDWLAKYSPMITHWEQGWIAIPQAGKFVVLQGEDQNAWVDAMLDLHLVHETAETEKPVILPEVQQLLDKFVAVFAAPSGLPPRRRYDHSIPLVHGARPVSMRPYRIAPDLKTELERQVQELLDQGVIVHSTSAFGSPVILVKKGDKTWRLVVDYRHLNALTVKGKYPLPVIDELLDELAGARWFSKLDLRAGYHQIRLAPGEEHKTAFQTHNGHFEFKVMAFGLTDFKLQFVVDTDACDVGIGAVLSQQGHPVAYVSHWQQKLLTKLMGFQYKILYKKGVLNGAADALSRKPPGSSQVFAITTVQPQWLSTVLDSYARDDHAQSLLQKLVVHPAADAKFTLDHGVLRCNGRIWVGADPALQQQIISAFHDSPQGGHSGFPVTYRRLVSLFAWPAMKKMVHAFVRSCRTCQQAKPERLPPAASDQVASGDIEQWLAEREVVMASARQHLLRMQQRMKFQADKNRRERVFAVGDEVFLRLQPYIQSSVVKRANHKLAFKFFGPYKIVERVGEVAYKLELPPTSRVHPVFHVSQLKPCIGPHQQVLSQLPSSTDIFQIPVAVLGQRVRQAGFRTVPQALIHWSGMPEDQATWEDIDSLRQQFPTAPAWGQAGFQAGGIVNDPATPSTSGAAQDNAEPSQAEGGRPARRKEAPKWLTDGNWVH
ncbi:hypothetical protein QYE76_034183 [Lolium multiflorum]|uniref:RNA-directed DNA polymerase n=1 Tax=Lolium multiflorum TaxID=4521 RepID=A0AAD8QY42_LOLMU|nr:hypothetical protein QYE76_034183 [Lolium multiflorum]